MANLKKLSNYSESYYWSPSEIAMKSFASPSEHEPTVSASNNMQTVNKCNKPLAGGLESICLESFNSRLTQPTKRVLKEEDCTQQCGFMTAGERLVSKKIPNFDAAY